MTNGRAASATRRDDSERPEGAGRTLLLGLMAAPGFARDLADRLAEELPTILEERFPEVDWEIAAGGRVLAPWRRLTARGEVASPAPPG